MSNSVEFLENLSNPFVLFIAGVKGYEDESDCWDIPDKTGTVFHILVRIREEMKWFHQRTGQDFYLFGVKRNWMLSLSKKLKDIGNPGIDLLFTVGEKIRLPGTDKLLPVGKERQPCWKTMISVKDRRDRSLIPPEIRLSGYPNEEGGYDPYYGFYFSNYELFPETAVYYLRCNQLVNVLDDKPQLKWNRNAFHAMKCDKSMTLSDLAARRIVARAKLIFPYIYRIEP